MSELAMVLETDAFAEDGTLDTRYTCDSDNSSPELRWNRVPQGTLSFALIAEDLDFATERGDSGQDRSAEEMTHWVIYNIPAHIHHLPTGIPAQESLPNGISQGTNSFGKLGYTGPCPPIEDKQHHYVFRLYALKSAPKLGRRLTKAGLMEEIRPHVLAIAETVGCYRRTIASAGLVIGARTKKAG